MLEPRPIPTTCVHCAVRANSLCSALSPIELSALSAISRHRTFDAGQVVVTEGERDVFCNIISGMLAEKKTMSDGREQIVSLLFPSDFHGNPIVGRSESSVHAVTQTKVCLFDRSGFDTLLSGFPALKQALFEHAMDSLAQARDWMLLLGQKSAEERVATFLLRMAERQADTGCAKRAHGSVANGTTIDVPITRAQIAAYLGLTIETVSRRLTALRDAKLIALQSSRSITLLDVPALQRTAGRLMDADCR